MSDLVKLKHDLETRIAAAQDLAGLDAIRVDALGKKGSISLLLKSLGQMAPEERQSHGARINALKAEITEAIARTKTRLEDMALTAQLGRDHVDVSLPALMPSQGSVHPVSQVTDEIIEIFADMGFAIAEGPEIEDDFHNFTALNFPPGHPAREMHDTFFFAPDDKGERKLLRTHTSTVQIRAMMTQKPPLRLIIPGRTYRCDSDATHTPQFHQLEGLVIDQETHMGHLRGCLEAFVTAFFEVDELRTRFRPSFFPFTEPSAEMDIGCHWENGQLKLGEGSDWMEILGCGMVHPNVIANCGLDPAEYQGFAFGVGIDRLAMLKYGMTDLRAFFDADIRWLKHYGFSAFDLPTLSGGVGA